MLHASCVSCVIFMLLFYLSFFFCSCFPQVMDMTKMTYPPASFDFVLDKAAMDALVTDEGDPWDPNEATKASTGAMMRSVAAVLRPGGVFVQISFQQPHFRKKYLAAAEGSPYDLRVEAVETVDVGLGYFFFVLRKGKGRGTGEGEAEAEQRGKGE